MIHDKLPPRLSNAEKHRRTLAPLRNAIRCLKTAVKEQDGLEWAAALRQLAEEAEQIERRLPVYADLAARGAR